MDTSFMIDSPECTDSPLEEDAFSNTKRNLLEDFACPTPMKASNVEPGEEHMKVFLRIRPFTEEETTSGENQGCMELENENLLTMHAPKDSVTFKNSTHGCGKTTHKFTFSKIFSDDVGQKAFFDDTMLSTVKDFVDGQNCLVFTYGITNAGKTYTIQGKPMDGGILPRALDVLFNSIENKQWESMTLKPKMFCDVVKLSERDLEHEQRVKDKVFRMASDEDPDVTTLLGDDASDMSRATNSTMASEESIMHSSSVDSGLDELDEAENRVREEMAIDVEAQGQIKFSVWVTFAEIYNEYIYDLLEPLPKKKNARRQVLTLREDKNGSPYVKGLKHIHVTSADEAYRILQIGRKNLQFACTKLNQNSSRSHCIFSIKVLRVVDKENPHMCRMSMLSLVDLAGSERYTKTQNTGDRLKEAGNINTSLLTLGRCISTLRYNQTHKENPKIIPFRESKLTRLFQSYFCGKGRACMIVNVNQLASAFDETLHVLKFSAIAKQVIVQKEEPKPKKSTLRNAARFVSLALQHSPTGARPSISWASPATIAQHSVEMAANLPIPEDDDEDLLESETEREETLKAIIAGLKEEMLAEKRKHALLEVQIREEVCQEMAEQLVEIENTYSERLKEGYLAAEEKADRRIEMYTQSVKSSRKRARIQRMDDEEDEWVSSVLLHAEQIKVKELENRLKDQTETLASVQAELASAQTSLKVAVDAKNGLQEEKSKGDFHMANEINELRKSHEKAMSELKADITRLEREKTSFEEKFKALDSQKPAGGDDMSDLVQNEIISNLTQQLEDAKETIASQASQISDLSEMLNEAGETFDEKNAEIEKLKKSGAEDQERLQAQAAAVEELKKLLLESKKALEVAEVKLQQRDETMVDLRQTVDTQKGSGQENSVKPAVATTPHTQHNFNSSVLLTPRCHDPNSSMIAQLFPNVGIGVVPLSGADRESCFSVGLSDSQYSHDCGEEEIVFKMPTCPQDNPTSQKALPDSNAEATQTTPLVFDTTSTQTLTLRTEQQKAATQTSPVSQSVGVTQTNSLYSESLSKPVDKAALTVSEIQTVSISAECYSPVACQTGFWQQLEQSKTIAQASELVGSTSPNFSENLSKTVSPTIHSDTNERQCLISKVSCSSSNDMPVLVPVAPEVCVAPIESTPACQVVPVLDRAPQLIITPVTAPALQAFPSGTPTKRETCKKSKPTTKNVAASPHKVNFAPLASPYCQSQVIPMVKFTAGFRTSTEQAVSSKSKKPDLVDKIGKENVRQNQPRKAEAKRLRASHLSKSDLVNQATMVLSPLRNSFVEQQTKTSLLRLCSSPQGQAKCSSTTCQVKRVLTDAVNALADKPKKRKVTKIVSKRRSSQPIRYNTRSRVRKADV